MRVRLLLVAVALLTAACSGSSADETTTTTIATTTTTSEATTTTESTTTTVAETTTTQETTTTTEPADTTTTSEGDGDTTTTSEGDTTTTTGSEGDTTTTSSFPPPPTTSSTTLANRDPDLEEWAGVFRQPTTFGGFMQYRADGVVRAGSAYDSMPFEGTWTYEAATDAFVFSNWDVGGSDCGDAVGRYARDTAPGGGRTLTLIEDECEGRVDFLTLPDSECRCMTWLRVVEPEEE